MADDDRWQDEPDDDDNPVDDDEAESLTVSCPSCGAEIYEDAVACPNCGTYVTADTSVWSGRSGWWIVLGLLGIVAVILALTAM